MKRSLIAAAGVLSLLAMPFVAAAHNAGHIFLPDGSCQEQGSFRPGPLVGPDGTQLDLVPQTPNPPSDEYGVSFVGFHSNTPILRGGCPAPTLADATPMQDAAGIPVFAEILYQ